ncbi:hypothetical protein [Cellulomonas cellasea]|uniref:Uncharacterized protein n=2 Tax=Cellulomonas cellasea TaxID=43670 RepID=A0A0A0BBS3_9CELL|nr:hypothetical protein [Cellulomonas cellasea]KGM03527.1 hypothetical protein Q760_02450 [Cellulomonas cellasea DSM 20118]GEA87130.1 hypothetical protein CCE01nite_10790 [Cellulomonas cellasea]
MPVLHVYFPAGPGRDAARVFASVRQALAGWPVAFGATANPFTQQEHLTVVVEGAYHLTVAFEQGEDVDADLAYVTGTERPGHARFRVSSGPDLENEHSDVLVELLGLADSLGPVLVYGVDAEQVLTDTLTSAPSPGA